MTEVAGLPLEKIIQKTPVLVIETAVETVKLWEQRGPMGFKPIAPAAEKYKETEYDIQN